MILYCNFEELSALAAAVERALEGAGAGHHPVVAPPRAVADLESLRPRLGPELTITSLAEHASVQRAVEHLMVELRSRLDDMVLDQHPAAEDAVLAYFDFAHVLTVARRLEHVGAEMAALVEVMTGQPANSEVAQRFSFLE
ncbi:MAG TPA: hypothetical protein VK939_01640 [Longimicrobiales bacterium]|nr:hypothetical protein [Longimicrobiales bacterium]